MARKLFTLVLLLSAVVLTGCAGTQVASYCDNCAPAPTYALAFTRPSLDVCNDFPINYRVQTPESSSRIRPIDRTTLYSR